MKSLTIVDEKVLCTIYSDDICCKMITKSSG